MAKLSQRTRQRRKKRAEKARAVEKPTLDESNPDPRAPVEKNAPVGSGDILGLESIADGQPRAKYGHSGRITFRTEARMEAQAIRQGWIKPNPGELFMTHCNVGEIYRRTSANADDVSMSDLATLTVLTALRSGDVRRASVAVRTGIAMVQVNLSIQYRAAELEHKRAVAAQKRRQSENSIPCGVVIMSRDLDGQNEFLEPGSAIEDAARAGSPSALSVKTDGR